MLSINYLKTLASPRPSCPKLPVKTNRRLTFKPLYRKRFSFFGHLEHVLSREIGVILAPLVEPSLNTW